MATSLKAAIMVILIGGSGPHFDNGDTQSGVIPASVLDAIPVTSERSDRGANYGA